MSETFKPGSVVQLKSKYGPRMTVAKSWTSEKGVEFCECHWFNGNSSVNFEHKEAAIPTLILEPYKD